MSLSDLLPPVGATPPDAQDLETLNAAVEDLRATIDARLGRASKWRGQMRRDIHRHAAPGDRARYAKAYNWVVSLAAPERDWKPGPETLFQIHARAVGGGKYRAAGLFVGGHHNFPPASEVPRLVEASLLRAASGSEPPAVAAARLHLNLISIHPFPDGNGRTARLIATAILAHASFRSSLLLCVEQHFHPDPRGYLDVLDEYQFGEISEEVCIAYFLRAMIANAMFVGWFRKRESRVRGWFSSIGIKAEKVQQALADFDLAPLPPARVDADSSEVPMEPPLSALLSRMRPAHRTELSFQLGRLLQEEREQERRGAGLTTRRRVAA